jgi:hypothetical protein
VLLALAIISTVAAVSSALSALGLLPQRRPTEPTVVIIVTSIEAEAVEVRADRPSESGPELESVA